MTGSGTLRRRRYVLGPPNRASIRTLRVIPKAVKIDAIVIPCSYLIYLVGVLAFQNAYLIVYSFLFI